MVRASEVIEGVNALAAPVFDHSARMVGSIAIVGATQYIPPEPARAQIEAVVGAAQRISRALGWKQHNGAHQRTSGPEAILASEKASSALKS